MAIMVGKYLCIAHTNEKLLAFDQSFKIYVASTNNPLLPVRFSTWKEAEEIATLIDKTYGEYLEILDEYPDWDILSIAKLSVPNGEEVYERIMSLNVSTEDSL